jgi:hypothetical protein
MPILARVTDTPTNGTENGGDARRALHAYLSDDAHDTWHNVAADLGCSVSAMLEAMATGFTDEEADRLEPTLKRARRIDADRRRR